MIDRIAFGIVAAALLLSALRVVTSKNLVHSVLWLGVTLASTAVAYLLLSAPFIASIQIMLYTGGIITLMLFGVMLTRRGEDLAIPNDTSEGGRALVLSLATFGLFTGAVVMTPLPLDAPSITVDTAELGRQILGPNLMAFEVLSVLLLAVMVGAIVVARRRDASVDHTAPGLRLDTDPSSEDGSAS